MTKTTTECFWCHESLIEVWSGRRLGPDYVTQDDRSQVCHRAPLKMHVPLGARNVRSPYSNSHSRSKKGGFFDAIGDFFESLIDIFT